MDQQSLYSLVLEYFKRTLDIPNIQIQVLGVISGVDEEVKRLNGANTSDFEPGLSNLERESINEIIWDLVIQRIIGITSQGLPWLYVTDYGKKIVKTSSPIPYDRDNYLATIYTDNPNLDNIAKSYLEESLTCLRGGAYRASAVMLGVASERLFEILVDAFQIFYKLKVPLIDRSKYKPFAQVRNAFMKLFLPRKKYLPADLCQDLEIVMDGVFLLIKNARDDSGHPSNINITREQMFSYLSLFPMYCERLNKMIAHYS